MTFRRRGSMKRINFGCFGSFLDMNEIDLFVFAEDREEMDDFVDEVIYYWDIEFDGDGDEEKAEDEKEEFVRDLKKYYGIA